MREDNYDETPFNIKQVIDNIEIGVRKFIYVEGFTVYRAVSEKEYEYIENNNRVSTFIALKSTSISQAIVEEFPKFLCTLFIVNRIKIGEIAVKVFVIDIYTQIWDDEGMEPIEDRHLKTVSYRLNIDVKDFSKELQHLIATELNNGYSFTIYEFENEVFARIEIFFREEYGYILDYLRGIGDETSYPDLNQAITNKLIQLPTLQREVREELISELGIYFDEDIKTSDSEMIYEKGFSNWDANLLIWVENIQISIVSMYVYDFLKKKRSSLEPTINKLHNHSDEEVLRIAFEKSGVNKNHLKIIDYKFNNEDKSAYYYITSRYADISMQISKDKEIIDFKLDKKTQTRI